VPRRLKHCSIICPTSSFFRLHEKPETLETPTRSRAFASSTFSFCPTFTLISEGIV
jgi:hypothetical protein